MSSASTEITPAKVGVKEESAHLLEATDTGEKYGSNKAVCNEKSINTVILHELYYKNISIPCTVISFQRNPICVLMINFVTNHSFYK